MKPSFKFYRGCYRFARVALGIFLWYDIRGRGNIPPGAAMVCANHSSLLDPIHVSLAFSIDDFIHYIAKVELYRIPVLSAVIQMLGAISVDREMLDVTTIKNTLTYFKKGEKVAIFPEGTRVSENESVAAKNGAIKLAEKAEVPIVPVYIPRKKYIFRKLPLVIGEPYHIEKQTRKRSTDEYSKLVEELMVRIEALKPTKPTKGAGVRV